MAADLLWILVPAFAVISFCLRIRGSGWRLSLCSDDGSAGDGPHRDTMLALSLNLIVAGGGFVHYLPWRSIFATVFSGPLILSSAPAAFLAAQVPVSRSLFQGLLGCLLLLAAVRASGESAAAEGTAPSGG